MKNYLRLIVKDKNDNSTAQGTRTVHIIHCLGKPTLANSAGFFNIVQRGLLREFDSLSELS